MGEEANKRASRTVRLLTRRGIWHDFVRTTRTDHAVAVPWLVKVVATSLVAMGTADPDWNLHSQVFMVEGAGHAPMLEMPEQVGPHVMECLEGLNLAAGRA